MYNILEKDTGRRINFTARSHDTVLRKEVMFQWKLTREGHFREELQILAWEQRVDRILSVSNSVGWGHRTKKKRDER